MTCSLRLLLLCAVLFPACGFAATSPADWDVLVLDKILAAVPPEQNLAQVGDMQILVSRLRAWRNQLAGGPGINFAFDGVAPAWTGGNLYYTFDVSVSAAKRKAFLDGAAEWAMFANLRFIPRTSQANYFTVKENPLLGGGQSALGMVGGQQFLEIGPGAWNRGTICHELGHTLGLVHEHQRSDRDSFVTILTGNILSGFASSFVKLPNTLNTGAYDFRSVMHYRRDAFSVSPGVLDTIQPLPAYARFLNVMGQEYDQVLSDSDRAGMAAKYGAGPVLSSVVTNTLDSGPGSLRAALYYALDHPGTTLTFNIPTNDPGFSGGVFTIKPTDSFPGLTRATVLDGSSQPGNSNPNGPEIVLNGALCDPVSVFSDGLRLIGSNCVVKAITINGFPGSGIVITGTNASGNSVRGCYLGLNSTGTAAATNRFLPMEISGGANGNIIGGTNTGAANVISGNVYQGLGISGAGTTGNIVSGNLLGLNAAGTAAIPNGWSGVAIFGGARSNLIGGASAAARNVISGNTLQGVTISDPETDGNIISGNYIGLNGAGTAAVPNGWSGLQIYGGAQANTIGGTAAGARNVISGNSYQGVLLVGTNTSRNVLLGNLIGVNPTGSSALGNGWSGLEIYGAAASNIVGGSIAGAKNVISGNGNYGVFVGNGGTDGNIIAGNHIGVNLAGSQAIGNTWSGLSLYGGARGNVVGGGGVGSGNVISGNLNAGVTVSGASTSGNLVQGNVIGLDATATLPLGNGWDGVSLYDGASGNAIGLALNGSGAANTIAFNNSAGIVMFDSNTINNSLRGNNVFSNGFLGINLVGGVEDFNGVNINDAADVDVGPNNLQNFPVITRAAGSGLNTILSATISAAPNRSVLIDFYRSDSTDPSQHGEGQQHIGGGSVTTDAAGAGTFALTVNGNFSEQYITATATDRTSGDTSEFSLAFLATNGPAAPTFRASPMLTSSGFVAQITLPLGQSYRVQATTNLGAVPIPWIDLTNFTPSATNYQFRDRVATNLPRRFYRVVSP